MSWSKIDDNLPDNPKLLNLTPAVQLVYVYSILYCHRVESDGFLDVRVANALLQRYVRTPNCTETPDLIEAGLWEEVDGGYEVHDYLKHQDSRERVEQVRQFNRNRQHKFRVTRYAALRNADVTVLDQSRSDQSRSEEKESTAPPRPRFVPPTMEEAKAFFTSKGVNGNSYAQFYAHYDSNGWKVGKNPMKSWMAAAAGWIMRGKGM